MRILADENIPCAREAFGPLGELRLMPGRSISRADIAGRGSEGIDALIVRSVTRVGEALLAGGRVRFVGTATIGTDHLDLEWLASNRIECVSAPGCNAESVAQYVAAALCVLSGDADRLLAGARLGVVGAGHCGSRVARVGRALGMTVLECDPPLARRLDGDAVPDGNPGRFRTLDEIAACDFVSFHVPLIRSGPEATERMIGAEFLARLKPGTCLINASRGGVADGPALLAAIRSGALGGVALDVWPDEPDVDPEMVRAVRLATPHIAGYSTEGKLAATETMHAALCHHAGREPFWTAREVLPEIETEIDLTGNAPEADIGKTLRSLIMSNHRIMEDDADMRRLAEEGSSAERRAAFDRLRRDYPSRREFGSVRVRVAADSPLAAPLASLGFSVAPVGPAPGR